MSDHNGNDELIPNDVANELTIPRIMVPRKEDFRGSVTPEEIASLKDAREISVTATFNKIEAQLDWLMQTVPPIYMHMRRLEARMIVSDRRFFIALKSLGVTIVGALVAALVTKWVGK